MNARDGKGLDGIDAGVQGRARAHRTVLNIDLGELPDEAEALYMVAHLASIACGGHAGDETTMRTALALCLRHGTQAGAHPSYPDREGFGRRRVTMGAAELQASVREQCTRLATVGREAGVMVRFVKAHGALYHAAREDRAVAAALLDGAVGALGRDVTFVGPGAGELRDAAERAGLAFLREGFADRATREDGTLVPRGEAGALILDPSTAAARARRLAASGEVDTVCVHGDSPGAVAIARAVRAALARSPSAKTRRTPS
jgi:5-oxoprolinase (ATP-hydrolysing) subunit A